jgi:hypothetical protein
VQSAKSARFQWRFGATSPGVGFSGEGKDMMIAASLVGWPSSQRQLAD